MSPSMVRVMKALGVIDCSDEGRRRDGAHAGDGAQARHASIVRGGALDRLVRIVELPVPVAQHGEERRDEVAQRQSK